MWRDTTVRCRPAFFALWLTVLYQSQRCCLCNGRGQTWEGSGVDPMRGIPATKPELVATVRQYSGPQRGRSLLHLHA